jgi:hypothetical protein
MAQNLVFHCHKAKMINVSMLTEEEIQYVNDYHQLCRTHVAAHLRETEGEEAWQWLMRNTESLSH